MQNEFDLNKMNEALHEAHHGNGEAQSALDERWKFIGKCVNDHGNVPDENFCFLYSKGNTKAHLWGLLIDELSDDILTGTH